MNAAPFLSTTWFSADERATATAIASMLSYLGGACAFLVGPLLVPAPNGTSPLLASENSGADIKDRIETVLYAGILKSIFFLFYFVFYPGHLHSVSVCQITSYEILKRTNYIYIYAYMCFFCYVIQRGLFETYPF